MVAARGEKVPKSEAARRTFWSRSITSFCFPGVRFLFADGAGIIFAGAAYIYIEASLRCLRTASEILSAQGLANPFL